MNKKNKKLENKIYDNKVRLLDTIELPQGIKKLSIDELNILAQEIREELVCVVSENGGHLASNLGVVEITIALFYVFNLPHDRVLFDVSHQCYVYKMLSGRLKDIKSLRKSGGLAGFSNPNESEFDSFIAGHSSTAISLGCGFARADLLEKSDKKTISIVGDGSLTGGMCYEALNEVEGINGKQLIIINDNEMSINTNVGATKKYLKKLRISKGYLKIKKGIYNFLAFLHLNKGKFFYRIQKIKNTLRYLFLGNLPFGQYKLPYYGPIDGHNIKELITYFNFINHSNNPIILHVITIKGKGHMPSEYNPEYYHGINANGCRSGEGSTFSSCLSKTLCNLANTDDKVVVITAAMGSSIGLSEYSKNYSNRFFDVGIAEEHAVTMCSAMAKSGFKPFFAVYSTFLQRAFDQLMHDCALMNLPLKLLIDRAGIVGEDGVTHQGIYDLSYLSCIPNMTIMSPKDVEELENMIIFAHTFNSPIAIRYPKGCYKNYGKVTKIEYAKWEVLFENNSDIAILAVGADMVKLAYEINENLENKVNIINARFIKPLDETLLLTLKNKTIITLEDNIKENGFGQKIVCFYQENNLNTRVYINALPNTFIRHASKKELFEEFGLCSENIIKIINNL